MKRKIGPTYTVRLYIGGDLARAKEVLRRECLPPNAGLCVTVEPTTFVYTGGDADGIVVELNDPRFRQVDDAKLLTRAEHIAERLISALKQPAALLVAPDKTVWLSTRPDNIAESTSTDSGITPPPPQTKAEAGEHVRQIRCDHCLKIAPAGSAWIIHAPRLASIEVPVVRLCSPRCLSEWATWYWDNLPPGTLPAT